MPKLSGRKQKGLGTLVLLVLMLLSFRAFTVDKPYDRDVSILLLTKSIAERDALVDLIIENKDFKRIDVHALEEQKHLRFSKYELIVLPAGADALKERLNKYFETGTGVFVYGQASSGDLNAVFGLTGDSEDILIPGSGTDSMGKLGKVKLAKAGKDIDYSFDIVGRYGAMTPHPGSFIRVDLGGKEDYNYKLLRALIDVHTDTKLRTFGNVCPSRISFYCYLGDGATVIREFLSLYRDYSYDVRGFYRFKLISELELRTREGHLDEIGYSVDTNEPASILEISPKVSNSVFSEVDKARSKSFYKFSSPDIMPKTLTGEVLHSSQSFQITTEELVLTTEVRPRIYYGSYRQYERYPVYTGRRAFRIEVLF